MGRLSCWSISLLSEHSTGFPPLPGSPAATGEESKGFQAEGSKALPEMTVVVVQSLGQKKKHWLICPEATAKEGLPVIL